MCWPPALGNTTGCLLAWSCLAWGCTFPSGIYMAATSTQSLTILKGIAHSRWVNTESDLNPRMPLSSPHSCLLASPFPGDFIFTDHHVLENQTAAILCSLLKISHVCADRLKCLCVHIGCLFPGHTFLRRAQNKLSVQDLWLLRKAVELKG